MLFYQVTASGMVRYTSHRISTSVYALIKSDIQHENRPIYFLFEPERALAHAIYGHGGIGSNKWFKQNQ